MFKKKFKYYVVFLLKREGTYSIIRKRRFNPTKEFVKFKDGSYPIDVSIPTYLRGLKIFYFVEVGKKQLEFSSNRKDNTVSPKVIDLVMSQKIVSELTANLSGSAFKLSILTLIIGCIIGGPIGFIVAGYV